MQVLGTALGCRAAPKTPSTVLEPAAQPRRKRRASSTSSDLALAAAGRGDDAIAALRRAVGDQAGHAGRMARAGRSACCSPATKTASREAYHRHLMTASREPELVEAASRLYEGGLAEAERLCRAVLKRHPTEVAAMRMLADIGMRLAKFKDAENLLARCLELAPDYRLARGNYAITLYRRQKYEAAIVELDRCWRDEPNDPSHLLLKSAILVRIGRFEEAIAIYERMLKHYPNQPKAHMSYGHALRAVGRQAEAIAAYRRSHPPPAQPGRGLVEPGQSQDLPASKMPTLTRMRRQVDGRCRRQRRPDPSRLCARQGAGGSRRI